MPYAARLRSQNLRFESPLMLQEQLHMFRQETLLENVLKQWSLSIGPPASVCAFALCHHAILCCTWAQHVLNLVSWILLLVVHAIVLARRTSNIIKQQCAKAPSSNGSCKLQRQQWTREHPVKCPAPPRLYLSLSLSLSLQHLANLRSEVTLTPNMEKLHPSSACWTLQAGIVASKSSLCCAYTWQSLNLPLMSCNATPREGSAHYLLPCRSASM